MTYEPVNASGDDFGAPSGPLSNQEADALLRVFKMLEVFFLARRTAPVQMVCTLLMVATDEGKSVKHYARKSGVSTSVMSRHLLDLSDTFRNGDAGLGLIVKRTASRSLREQEVYLSPRGREMVKRAADALMRGARLDTGEREMWLPI